MAKNEYRCDAHMMQHHRIKYLTNIPLTNDGINGKMQICDLSRSWIYATFSLYALICTQKVLKSIFVFLCINLRFNNKNPLQLISVRFRSMWVFLMHDKQSLSTRPKYIAYIFYMIIAGYLSENNRNIIEFATEH